MKTALPIQKVFLNLQVTEKSVGFKNRNDMKKLILSLLLLCAVLSSASLKAQPIGLERRVPLKNLYFGVKAGATALGMHYTNKNFKEPIEYNNPSALWQGEWQNCLAGGITVERTLPHFSYGLEGMVMGLDAKSLDSEPIAKKDSAWLVDVRVPLRVKFLEDYVCSPYVMIAPCYGSYLTAIDSIYADGHTTYHINGQSEWNGATIDWGESNTKTHHFSLLAGIGMDVKIPIGNYEAKLRVESTYQLGVSNLYSKKITHPKDKPENKVSRTMRGWETTIGICFPLFSNPHYAWLM